MRFNIKDISSCSPRPNKNYLFDTNVWMIILGKNIYKGNQEKYVTFFEKFKNSIPKPPPRIILLSLILSEIINSCLGIARIKYADREGIPKEKQKEFFKNKRSGYRTTDDYKKQYRLICDDMKSYNTFYEIVNDEFNHLNLQSFLKNPPIKLDFNDYYYYRLAKKKGYTIVTHDGDFFVEDVEIITANQTLLSRIEVFHYKK